MIEASQTPYLVGAGLALAVALGARLAGLDRDRAFYPTIVMVVASYYDLFAVMGGSTPALTMETGIFVLFVAAALLAFRFNLWIAVAALALHGSLDLVHGAVVANPGVPAWWPGFCSSYDLAAAAGLAWRLSRPGLTGPTAKPRLVTAHSERAAPLNPVATR